MNKRVFTGNSRAIPEGAKNGISLPVLRIDGVDYNLEEMKRADLIDLSALLKADIDNIEFQRESGHNGAWANPEWEPRAIFAQKMKGTQITLIQSELSRRKDSVPSLTKYFVDAAWEMLSKDLFTSIMEAAKGSHRLALGQT